MKGTREENKKLREKIEKEYKWLCRKYLESYVKEGETCETRLWNAEAVGFSRAIRLVDNKYNWGERFDAIFEDLKNEYGTGGYNIIENNFLFLTKLLSILLSPNKCF